MSIISQILQIFTRQRAPQDLQYNQTAAIILFCVMVVFDYLVYSVHPEHKNPLLLSLVTQSMRAFVFFMLLRFHDKSNRFVQTITAMLGISFIVQSGTLLTIQYPSLVIFQVALHLWSFYLSVIILKAALDCSIIKSVLLTIGASMFILIAVLMVFPNLPAEIVAISEAAKAGST